MSTRFPLVLLTPPDPHPQELAVAARWLSDPAAATRLHLRRPDWSRPQMAAWLHQMPAAWRPRVVVHGFPELVAEFGLGGCHLTATARAAGHRPTLPPGATLSTALHTLAEVQAEAPAYDYVLLSPIFDSISKSGYAAAFSLEAVARELRQLPQARVLALGGVTAAHLPRLQAAGFAGAAVLGTVWQAPNPVAAAEQLLTTAQTLASRTT